VAFLLTLFAVHLLALATPGPDFLLVSRMAMGASRRAALMAAAGVALGVMAWAALALAGLHLLLEQVAWLQRVIKIAGGLYLVYLGVRMLQSSLSKPASSSGPQPHAPSGDVAAFRLGLLTNLANPKAAIYFGSVFASFLTESRPLGTKAVMFTLVSLETLVWFALVGTLFSLPVPRRWYEGAGRWIDGVAGAAFALFGLRLIFASRN
jgi:threonine efflux protein